VADFPINKKTLMREMALLKVVSSKAQLEKAKKLCTKYKYTLLDKTEKYFVFEVSALKKEIDELIKKLQSLGLVSASRTGVVAMTKGPEIYK
jgi:acetolactate synthase-1/3 small subunit